MEGVLMKIELEISDEFAFHLARKNAWLIGGGCSLEPLPKPTTDQMVEVVNYVIRRYGDAPELLTEDHRKAMTVLRSQAVTMAANMPGNRLDPSFRSKVDDIMRAFMRED
jgi:hypothetical protein